MPACLGCEVIYTNSPFHANVIIKRMALTNNKKDGSKRFRPLLCWGIRPSREP